MKNLVVLAFGVLADRYGRKLIMLVGPLVAYPFSKTIWVAVDRAFLQKLDRAERPDEQIGHF